MIHRVTLCPPFYSLFSRSSGLFLLFLCSSFTALFLHYFLVQHFNPLMTFSLRIFGITFFEAAPGLPTRISPYRDLHQVCPDSLPGRFTNSLLLSSVRSSSPFTLSWRHGCAEHPLTPCRDYHLERATPLHSGLGYS